MNAGLLENGSSVVVILPQADGLRKNWTTLIPRFVGLFGYFLLARIGKILCECDCRLRNVYQKPLPILQLPISKVKPPIVFHFR